MISGGMGSLLRSLLTWQKIEPEARMEARDALEAIIAQLEGLEAAAGAWEAKIIPSRLAGYGASWLDDLCLADRIVWTRLKPRSGALTPPALAFAVHWSVRSTSMTISPGPRSNQEHRRGAACPAPWPVSSTAFMLQRMILSHVPPEINIRESSPDWLFGRRIERPKSYPIE